MSKSPRDTLISRYNKARNSLESAGFTFYEISVIYAEYNKQYNNRYKPLEDMALEISMTIKMLLDSVDEFRRQI